MGGVCPPPSFFFRAAGGGVVLGPVVSWLCGVRRCPSRSSASWSPSPLPLRLGCVYVYFFFRWPATSPVGCVPACPGCPFLCWDAALYWALPGLAGCSSGVLSGRPVGVPFGVVWPGRLPLLMEWVRGFAVVRLSPAPPFFLPAGVRSWLGGGSPVLCCLFVPFFFGGRFACSSLYLPWAGARTGRHSVWLTGLLLMLRLAGPCPGPMGRVGYARAWPGGLTCWVRFWLCQLGGCADGFVRSSVKGGGVFRVPPPFWCRLYLSGGGLCGRAVAVAAGRAVAPSLCAAGWCGVVARLWARFLPFRGARRLARVRPTVSVPCFGAVVCFGAPCCVVLCFAVLRRAGLCCVAVRSALSCRAAPCRAVVCLALSWLAAPCCAAQRRVVLCCVVSWAALSWCLARRSAALRCAVLPRVVLCFAVPWCLVGPFHCHSGVEWGRRCLDWPASWCGTRAEVMWLAGGWGARLCVVWLVGSVLQGSGWAVWAVGLGGCPRGCPPWGPVPWSPVL